MKKLITLFAVIALFGCQEEKAYGIERTQIYNSTLYEAFKLRVDSADYIIVKSTYGVSIIKHGDVKK